MYFRIGYSTYLVFFVAAINFLVLTFYLAIQAVPQLGFLVFWLYCLIAVPLGMILACCLGYIHYKRTGFYQAEQDVSTESNPYSITYLVPTAIPQAELLSQLGKLHNLDTSEIDELIERSKRKFGRC